MRVSHSHAMQRSAVPCRSPKFSVQVQLRSPLGFRYHLIARSGSFSELGRAVTPVSLLEKETQNVNPHDFQLA